MPLLPTATALGVFAGVTAFLVLLFLLRQRARRVVVPTLAPWREGRPRRVDPLWRELAALLLQILAAGLLCAALVEPKPGDVGAPEAPRVLIVDGSASMRAAGRIAAAREMVSALDGGIILAGREPRVLARPDAGEAARQNAIARIEAGWGGADLVGAVALARELGWTPEILSDHGPETDELPWRVVGAGGSDLAVVSVLASAGPGLPPEHAVRVVLANHGPARTARLRLEGETGTLGEEEVALDAEATLERTWRVDPIQGLWARVRVLDAADALPDNDVGYALLPPLRPAEVWLLGPGNRFLEGVLRLMPGLRLRSGGSGASPDLVIFDRATPRRVPDGAAIALLDPPPGVGPLPAQRTVEDPVFTRWDYAHPLLRGVALRQLAVERVSVLDTPRPASVIASVAEGPVIAMPEGGNPTLVLGFDLTRSDLPLSIGFPQLVYNLVLWSRQELASGPTRSAEAEVALDPRGPVVLRRLDEPGEARWEGAAVRLAELPPGAWSIDDAGGERAFVTGFDAAEFARPGAGEAPPARVEEAAVGAPTPRWLWLALLALVALWVEFGVAPR